MTVKERQLQVEGVLENVPVICDFVVAQAREAGLDERAIHHCYLAVDEACTNIIEHGYRLRCDECIIDVFCEPKDHALSITILDDSPAFDPLTRADPDPATPLNERGVGGWGIFFIKKLMDEVSYSYEDRRNRLTMVKKLSPHTYKPREQPLPEPVEVTALSDKVWRVVLSGRLDEPQSRQVASTLSGQLGMGHRWLVLDMAGVEYISSAGLKMLVSFWQRVRDQKGDLALAALQPRVREVLEMIGLDLVFSISETPDQAKAHLDSKMP